MREVRERQAQEEAPRRPQRGDRTELAVKLQHPPE
jgi:hypothetical protein